MDRAAKAALRGRVALGFVLGVALLLLVPVLGSPDPAAPAAATALLALIALVAWLPASSAVAALAQPAVAPDGDATPPVLASRATDPVHHPRRPRAPGPA